MTSHSRDVINAYVGSNIGLVNTLIAIDVKSTGMSPLSGNSGGMSFPTSQLQGIRVPTLVVVGDNDILLPLKYSTIIHQNIPNSELKTIEDASHLSTMGNSGRPFNETVLEFLRNRVR